MSLILLSFVILCSSGLIALCCGRSPRAANSIGAIGTVSGCLTGLIPAVSTLWTGQIEIIRQTWSIPLGSLYVKLDALSAFFLLPVLCLCAVSAIYGKKYLLDFSSRKKLGCAWFFFTFLVASMMLVVIAQNGILFLMGWEVMSLSSFFLVCFEDEKEDVRRAGWIYLVATHIGTACLCILFILLAQRGQSLDFDHFSVSASDGAFLSGTAFVLCIIGFGTKAGFMPFHVWLPEAHPAAPSYVSAVMSGVMIKTGIYGLVRFLSFLGQPAPWWGWLMIVIGLISGLLGVLFALAQHDLKRLLAYHSVENIGIIALGLGLGILGLALNQPVLAVLGFAGGLLHVLNHALFKGLLFLCAGAVLHTTGVRNIEHLGGLIRRMPWTGTLFLVGSIAICGLPPLNGFISEFLIYMGAFRGMGFTGVSLSSIGVIAGLAAIGGLAAACFTKAFGIVFLGEPRTPSALQGHEVGWSMRAAMIILAVACAGIGFLGPHVVSAMTPVLEIVTGFRNSNVQLHLLAAVQPLNQVSIAAYGMILILLVMTGLRRLFFRGKKTTQTGTWDCGYIRPTSRMQYTASSYAQPLTSLFGIFLQTRQQVNPPEDFFPVHASLHTDTRDIFFWNVYQPLFRGIERLLMWFHWMQQGRVQVYILYVAVTLLVLLIWNLR